jgi:hypothetical protein
MMEAGGLFTHKIPLLCRGACNFVADGVVKYQKEVK